MPSISNLDRITIGLKANTRLSSGLLTFVNGFLEGSCHHKSIAQTYVFANRGGRFLVGWGEVEPSSDGHCLGARTVVPGNFRSPVVLSLYDRTVFPRTVAKVSPDILLCPGNVAVRIPGVKTVFWPQTVLPPARMVGDIGWHLDDKSLKSRIFETLQLSQIRRSYKLADGIIFSSRYARDLYAKAFGAAKVPTTIIYPPGKNLGGDPQSTDNKKQTSTFLFVSTLSPYKMVYELVIGFSTFLKKFPSCNYRLVIAGREGNPDYAQRIDDLVDELQLKQSVTRLGLVSNSKLADLYGKCRYFVFPSACENAGSFALLDALAYGKTILCSNLSSMPEICGPAALYFDPRDPEEVTNCLSTVVSSSDLARDLADRALARGARFQGWDHIVEQVMIFFQTVLTTNKADLL